MEGLRGHFPVSFGKTSKLSAPIESIHSTTRRTDVANEAGDSSDYATKNSNPGKSESGFPSLSSSSGTWLRSVRGPNRNPNSSSLAASGDDVAVGPPTPNGVSMGPPPPPKGLGNGNDSDNDGVLMGPPPPPKGTWNGNESDDDEEMIGPPPPPPAATSDVDSDEDDDDDENDNEENRYKIPLSNEIQLKGHTKVIY